MSRRVVNDITERLVRLNGTNFRIVRDRTSTWTEIRVWRWSGHRWELLHRFDWVEGRMR